MVNPIRLSRTSHKRMTFICFAPLKKLDPFLNKALISKYILALFALLSIPVSW